MSIDNEQKINFTFNEENWAKYQEIIKKYPKIFSAVMPVLDLAQRQNNNYLTEDILMYVSKLLTMPYAKVLEVATFYSMYNMQPVGRFLIQICRTTPCLLCNSESILTTLKEELEIDLNETTNDGIFTLKEVECLGACVDAPVVQINDTYYEKLTPQKMKNILCKLKAQALDEKNQD